MWGVERGRARHKESKLWDWIAQGTNRQSEITSWGVYRDRTGVLTVELGTVVGAKSVAQQAACLERLQLCDAAGKKG
jgi:hypothetical protein